MRMLHTMRGLTGRAVSAAIHSRLQQALTSGEPMTYVQLATAGGCTVRSVRNYLARSREIFGFEVEHSRPAGGHAVVVRAVGSQRSSGDSKLAASLATGLLARLFPDSSAAGQDAASPNACLRVSLRGMPVYSSHLEAALDTWIQVAAQRPRRAVRLHLAQSDDTHHGELMLWPLCAVLHNIDGIRLVGLPIDADHTDALQVVDLQLVRSESDAVQLLEPKDTGDPSVDLSSIDLGDVLDLPFTTRPRSADPKARVDVHVRFSPASAPRLQQQLLHRSQRAVLRTDGSLDIRFGPIDIDVAASWVASFGDSVRVLGDKRLRRVVKKRTFSA